MTSLRRSMNAIFVLLLCAGCSAGAAFADSGHARIVRLSLVQGDVRFARDVKGDPLTDSHGNWEAAVLNLPIRQGYAVATDNGRAEVEFENGAMAFLAENTVLEFYDLSSEDGSFTTRLILRQGSAEFYVHPGRGDYFSITGGDFSVQAETRTTFRMNNFDDGSSVNVLQGRLTALTDGKNTLLEKDQSLSLRAGEPDSLLVERAPASDDFDQWVSGRIETVNTATNASLEYSNSNDYSSGFADLYTYGAWFPVAGYGNCWRPYGVGLGWSPFDYGSWYFDPLFGWSFIGGQPWGWLPYHYGGWLFRPGVGWVWSPTGSFGAGVGRWRPVTGVWMRSGGSVGIVPRHPLDVKGKTPLNFPQGVFAVTTRGVSGRVATETSEHWKVENKPARDVMQSQLATAAAPARVSRTMAMVTGTAGSTGSKGATTARDSTIIYDRTERRFVNSDAPQARNATENSDESEATSQAQGRAQGQTQGQARVRIYPEQNRSGDAQAPPASHRVTGGAGQTAAVPDGRSVSPPRPTAAPPSVPRSVTHERVFNGAGASNGGSARGTSTPSSAPAPRASQPSSSGSSARSSSSGGGRPH
jgi:FecR protein